MVEVGALPRSPCVCCGGQAGWLGLDLSDVSTYFSNVGFDKTQNVFCQALFSLITCVYFKGNLIHMFLIRLHGNH